MAIPTDALDTMIAKHMTARLLDRNRLKIILTQILQRRRELIARDGEDRLDELTRRGEEARQAVLIHQGPAPHHKTAHVRSTAPSPLGLRIKLMGGEGYRPNRNTQASRMTWLIST